MSPDRQMYRTIFEGWKKYGQDMNRCIDSLMNPRPLSLFLQPWKQLQCILTIDPLQQPLFQPCLIQHIRKPRDQLRWRIGIITSKQQMIGTRIREQQLYDLLRRRQREIEVKRADLGEDLVVRLLAHAHVVQTRYPVC